MNNSKIDISAIIPISESRLDDINMIYDRYVEGLNATQKSYELIFVFDGERPSVWDKLKAISDHHKNVKLILLSKTFGESVAINAGFENATGDIILTLPPYLQINPSELPKLLNELDKYDMVVANRSPRIDPSANRLQARIFHKILNRFTEIKLNDIGCSVRAFKRIVFEEVNLYGDLHRFLPHLAHRKGFRVVEIDLQQAQEDTQPRIHPPGIYIRRLLDLLSVFFLTKFTKKPLRFFGLIGTFTFSAGLLLTIFLIFERMFFGVPLADRPLLIISSLFMVLGIQVLAIGLLGEIIIFTHAKDLKEYTIEKIVN